MWVKYQRAVFFIAFLVAFAIVCSIRAPVPIEAQSPTLTKTLSTTTCPGVGCFVVDVSNRGSASIQVTGTFVGTLQFEQSVDGTNFTTWSVTANGATTTVTSATATGYWTGSITTRYIRVRFSAYTSGSAVVNLISTQARAGGGSGGGMCSASDTCTSATFGSTISATADNTWQFSNAAGTQGWTLAPFTSAGSTFIGMGVNSRGNGSTSGAISVANYGVNARMFIVGGSPTFSPGGWVLQNGQSNVSFHFTVGTSSPSSGTITFAAGIQGGPAISCNDETSNSSFVVGQTAHTATTATIAFYARTTGLLAAPNDNDHVVCHSAGF